MKRIKTIYGTLEVGHCRKLKEYYLYDNASRLLARFDTKRHLKNFVEVMNAYDNIGDWLENYEDVCWSVRKKDVIDTIKDYQKRNGRAFDLNYFEETYNKLGRTYIMFGYSDCYKE